MSVELGVSIIAANGQGFMLCWYSLLVQPKLKPIEKLKLKLYSFVEIYSFSPDCC
jgi:hypothetical protein